MRRFAKWAAIVVAVALALCAVLLFIGPPKVPPEAIARSVQRDEALMDRAFALPVATTYGRELESQSNGSLCGPASILNMLSSIDRPLDDESAVLDGSGLCWSGMCLGGITLDQLGDVARLRTERKVTVLRDLSEADFHDHMRRANDPARRYIVNFARNAIFGAGGGHHSPIGGYLEAEDLVLVLDVNHDFGPWLVERERLFAAIDTVDGASDAKRGLLLIE